MKMEIVGMYVVAISALGGLVYFLRWHYRNQTKRMGPGPDTQDDDA